MRERIHLILGALATLFDSAHPTSLSLEQKLDILARCGLKLELPFTISDLLGSWKREAFDKAGFNLVLVGLGMSEERPPWRSHCLNAWHFDTECIQNNGDYCRIAERLKQMTQGSLPIDKIRDHVDIEGRSAWLAFDYRGQEIRIDCRINDDWIDARLFSHFVDLLAKSDPFKIYIYYDLHGQDCMIACVTKEQFARLKQSGIAFQPLH